jgi:hypothetical protein
MTMGNLLDLVAFAISTLTLHVSDRLSVFDEGNFNLRWSLEIAKFEISNTCLEHPLFIANSPILSKP